MENQRANVVAIGQHLKVGLVLEGSVRKEGDRFRITAQLVSTADGFHHWTERYDRESRNTFAVQEDLSRLIVETVTEQRDRLANAPAVSA